MQRQEQAVGCCYLETRPWKAKFLHPEQQS